MIDWDPEQARVILRQSIGQGEAIVGGRRFRVIEGFPRYMVSDHGDVFSGVRATRFLKASISPVGYPYVSLMGSDGTKGIKHTVHTLVAKAFHPNPLGMPTVNHKDGVKTNCHFENLEWATYADNNDHARKTGLNRCMGETHHSAMLNDDLVREIRKLVDGGEFHHVVAERFGIKRRHVTKIVNRLIWAHVS
jgi:HNH endonuclease